MVTFVQSRDDVRTETTTSSNSNSSAVRTNSVDYNAFAGQYGEYFRANYTALKEQASLLQNDNERRIAQLGNDAGIRREWQSYINNPQITNLAGFRSILNDFVANDIGQTNQHERVFQDIISTMVREFGDVQITMPYNNEKITVKEAIDSGNLNLYINSPEFKAVMNQAIEFLNDGRHPQMQELQRLAENLEPEAAQRMSIGGQWFRGGLTYTALRQGSSLFKYNVVDRFTGKHAIRKELIKQFGKSNEVTFTGKSVYGTGFGEGVPKDIVKCTKKAADLKKYASVAARDKLLASGATKSAKLTKQAVKIGDQVADVVTSTRKLKKVADAAKAAKDVGRMAGWLGKIKLGWTAASTGMKAAGAAGGPLGLAVTLLGGFALDLVIGEAIDAVGVVANGGELTAENKKAWIPFGEWLGQGLHGLGKWIAG